jgi:3-mercaptopyruvate sulfurtransferase SseA
MRQLITAVAIMALAGGASAQYKTPPPGTPAVPVTANPNVQITPAPAPEQPQDTARRISRDEAIKEVDHHKAIFVDVRPKDQYDIEHIKGAINIPLAEITARADELPKNKFIVTYCA